MFLLPRTCLTFVPPIRINIFSFGTKIFTLPESAISDNEYLRKFKAKKWKDGSICIRKLCIVFCIPFSYFVLNPAWKLVSLRPGNTFPNWITKKSRMDTVQNIPMSAMLSGMDYTKEILEFHQHFIQCTPYPRTVCTDWTPHSPPYPVSAWFKTSFLGGTPLRPPPQADWRLVCLIPPTTE